MKNAKRGPKRASIQVQNRKEILAIHADRATRGLSWREIERKRGLISRNGMSARNLFLRAVRMLSKVAS